MVSHHEVGTDGMKHQHTAEALHVEDGDLDFLHCSLQRNRLAISRRLFRWDVSVLLLMQRRSAGMF
jgi:hypothetical protein